MSENGENIVKLHEEIGKIYKQISLLLKTTDELMDQEGWKGYKKVVSSGSSLSLDYPEKWFPHILFRFYTNDEIPHILAFISILLMDDIYENYEIDINEPLITAGHFNFGEGKEVGDNLKYWYAKCFGYYGNNQNDEGIINGTVADWNEDWKDKFNFKSYKCFGLPLTSITNISEIESKIIHQLISL